MVLVLELVLVLVLALVMAIKSMAPGNGGDGNVLLCERCAIFGELEPGRTAVQVLKLASQQERNGNRNHDAHRQLKDCRNKRLALL